MQDAGCRMQDTRYKIQDTGYRIQDTGYRIQDTGYRIQDTGYRNIERDIIVIPIINCKTTRFHEIIFRTRIYTDLHGFFFGGWHIFNGIARFILSVLICVNLCL